MPSKVLPMVTIGCQWVLPLVANLADNLECRQNYQRAKWRHFQDCNLWKFRNYCSIYWVPELKFLWSLVLATPMSVCSYNGVVENDDLLSLFTTNRKLPMATDIRSQFSDCNWYQWQPMAASGTNGKITSGTIGKTPNARLTCYITSVCVKPGFAIVIPGFSITAGFTIVIPGFSLLNQVLRWYTRFSSRHNKFSR